MAKFYILDAKQTVILEKLYPLKFQPIFKDKIWGGNKIKSVLNKDYRPLPNCGETWEISGVNGNVSIVANGALSGKSLSGLMDEYGHELVGRHVMEHSPHEFPLLVKFIDANDDLSIQVHPDDELAKARHNCLGKTEMWYVVQADNGSSLITGFNRQVNKEVYEDYFNRGKLEEILNREEVNDEDVFYLPAGRVHTIGKGLLIAEIQQTSDITYRIYDFDRADANGNKRELHVQEALDAIDYNFYEEYKSKYDRSPNQTTNLVSADYFITNRICTSEKLMRNYSDIDSFIIYVVVQGTGKLIYTDGEEQGLKLGDCILIPACIEVLEIIPYTEMKILESYVPVNN